MRRSTAQPVAHGACTAEPALAAGVCGTGAYLLAVGAFHATPAHRAVCGLSKAEAPHRPLTTPVLSPVPQRPRLPAETLERGRAQAGMCAPGSRAGHARRPERQRVMADAGEVCSPCRRFTPCCSAAVDFIRAVCVCFFLSLAPVLGMPCCRSWLGCRMCSARACTFAGAPPRHDRLCSFYLYCYLALFLLHLGYSDLRRTFNATEHMSW